MKVIPAARTQLAGRLVARRREGLGMALWCGSICPVNRPALDVVDLELALADWLVAWPRDAHQSDSVGVGTEGVSVRLR